MWRLALLVFGSEDDEVFSIALPTMILLRSLFASLIWRIDGWANGTADDKSLVEYMTCSTGTLGKERAWIERMAVAAVALALAAKREVVKSRGVRVEGTTRSRC